MIGAIAGDIIGSPYEFRPHKSVDFPLFGPDCRITDDTVLTVALAEAIIWEKDYCQLLKKYYRRYPNAGYGGTFAKWAASDYSLPYNSFGNGSAMRISPVGFWYNTLEEVLAKAAFYTSVTHNHPEGIKGAQATAAAIFMARNGGSKEDIRRYITETFGYDLTRTCHQIRPSYQFDVTCQGSVPEAIICFLESTDFESAVRLAVSLGGDSDTQACIAGGIAEAMYGVPEWIAEKAMTHLDRKLCGIVETLYSSHAFGLCCPEKGTPADLRRCIEQWKESVSWIGDESEYDHDVLFRYELDCALEKYRQSYPLHKADAEKIEHLDEMFRSITIETDRYLFSNLAGNPTWLPEESAGLSSSEFRKKYWYFFRWPPGMLG